LVDVTLTVMVLGILAATAVPRFISSLDRCRTQTAAAQIQADLGLARQWAMAKSGSLTVRFAAASDQYALEGLDHPDRRGESYVIRLNRSPYRANLVSAVLGGDEAVVFNAFGLPDSGGTITVESGGWTQSVTLDPDTGQASLP
jgi:type II secretory pathway pseudopilin PulG